MSTADSPPSLLLIWDLVEFFMILVFVTPIVKMALIWLEICLEGMQRFLQIVLKHDKVIFTVAAVLFAVAKFYVDPMFSTMQHRILARCSLAVAVGALRFAQRYMGETPQRH